MATEVWAHKWPSGEKTVMARSYRDPMAAERYRSPRPAHDSGQQRPSQAARPPQRTPPTLATRHAIQFWSRHAPRLGAGVRSPSSPPGPPSGAGPSSNQAGAAPLAREARSGCVRRPGGGGPAGAGRREAPALLRLALGTPFRFGRGYPGLLYTRVWHPEPRQPTWPTGRESLLPWLGLFSRLYRLLCWCTLLHLWGSARGCPGST